MRRLIVGMLVAGVLAAQAPEPSLRITGAVKQELTLAAADLAKMPRATVRVTVHGTESTYEGVWLHEVLKRAGVPQGEQLRGKALAGYVLAVGDDGYAVVFSLAELDPSFVDSQFLLADTADGKPLGGAQGRFRLVAAKDKPAARSVRMLKTLEVVQLRAAR